MSGAGRAKLHMEGSLMLFLTLNQQRHFGRHNSFSLALTKCFITILTLDEMVHEVVFGRCLTIGKPAVTRSVQDSLLVFYRL